LTTDQVVALSSAQLNALSTTQIRALSTNSIQALETADIAALQTSSMSALNTAQFSRLTTDQIKAMTTNQFASVTTQQIHALTSAQVQAMTTAQVAALKSLTPIVLDLNGNGIDTLNVSAGVKFDMLATGQKVNTGWVGGGDGLLALDRNGDGVIDSGAELFGSGTTLADGNKATTGYQALGELDSNGDGTIDAKDAQFSNLRVWVDGNADGVSQADELKSLADLSISKLNLDAKQNVSLNNGNFVGITSTYETTDGATHAAADVWFAAGAASTNLTSSVSGLASAMSSFGAAAASSTVTKLEVPSSANMAVAAMASAISNYDNKLSATSNSASTEETLRLKALQGAHHQGILAAK